MYNFSDVTPAKAGVQGRCRHWIPALHTNGRARLLCGVRAFAGMTALAGWLLFSSAAQAAGVPAEWRSSQDVQVAQKGLVKAQLPLETLSNAQPELGDLRLIDPAGQEISYFIDKPMIQPARQMPLSGMTMTMSGGKTVMMGQVPPALLSDGGFDALYLYTATDDFLKPRTLEGSRDQRHWTRLVDAHPIFKQPGDALSTSIEFVKSDWPYLRITLDDSATPPIRVQSVTLYAAAKKPVGLQSVTAQILETSSDAHQTEIQLLLPADNLTIDAIRLETSEGTFRRRVTVWAKTFSAGEFREIALGQGTVYKVALDRQLSEHVAVPLSRQVPGRQVILRIENGDSRPLAITRIAMDVVPAYLVFDAPSAGTYTLWVGNLIAAPKNYDVAALRDSLAEAAFLPAAIGGLNANTVYKPPEPLPQVGELGSDIDTGPWRFRKKVTLLQAGIQRIEPDLDVLSHNAGHPAALRVVQDGKQLPYVLDQAGVGRTLDVRIEPGEAKGTVSQWVLTLPSKGLPITSLRFTVQEPLFQRGIALYEEVLDERGETVRQLIGGATWVRVNGEAKEGFVLTLSRTPGSNKLFLEADNRDNPPIHLTSARGFYQTSRILFKASPGRDTYLYYGNDDVAPPQYDLDLIAGDILATPPSETQLGPEDILKAKPWWEAPVPAGGMKYAFWVVLSLVVVGLLVIIAKLLPPEAAAGAHRPGPH